MQFQNSNKSFCRHWHTHIKLYGRQNIWNQKQRGKEEVEGEEKGKKEKQWQKFWNSYLILEPYDKTWFEFRDDFVRYTTRKRPTKMMTHTSLKFMTYVLWNTMLREWKDSLTEHIFKIYI